MQVYESQGCTIISIFKTFDIVQQVQNCFRFKGDMKGYRKKIFLTNCIHLCSKCVVCGGGRIAYIL